jgi:hypothetical protein
MFTLCPSIISLAALKIDSQTEWDLFHATREASKSLAATTDRLGPSGTQSRGFKCFLSEHKLEQVIEEIYDNEGSEVDWSDSDV